MSKTSIRFTMALVGAAFAAMLVFAPAASADISDEEFQQLQGELETIKSDLAEIKKLLQSGARAAPAAPTAVAFEPTDISVEGSPLIGDDDAVITLVEYSDFQCPYCQRHYSAVMPEIVRQYVDTGKVKYVMREFPLTALHPRAMDASNAALCAQEQGQYWEMHDLLFDNQRQMSMDDFKAHSETLGLDQAEFDACLESRKFNDHIRESLAEGNSLGIRGTPSFVIGLTDGDDPNKATVTKFIRGAQGLDSFTRAIEELLAEAGEGAAAENEGP